MRTTPKAQIAAWTANATLKALGRASIMSHTKSVDTPDAYRPYTNEVVLGRAIQGRRAEVILATKFGSTRDERGVRSVRGDAAFVAHIGLSEDDPRRIANAFPPEAVAGERLADYSRIDR